MMTGSTRPGGVIAALALTFALAACSDEPEGTLYGYADGDFVTLAMEIPGRIVETGPVEGEPVLAGDRVARLDATDQQAAVAAAEARLAAATARFDDAAAGARSPEIAAARDQLDQAQAAARDAGDTLARTVDLFAAGHVSQARLDQVRAAANAATAREAEMRERLNLIRLPAREHQLAALQAEVSAAAAELDRARHGLARTDLHAPADGVIHRQIRYEGEIAGPAAPVYALLPAGAVHAVLFIPEAQLQAFPAGTRLSVSCDGCAPELAAVIATVEAEAEFTPPVIYSDAMRERLVWRAEAHFDGRPPLPGTPLRFERAE